MESNKEMQDFLALFDSNVVNEAKAETITELVRKKMLVSAYNEELQQKSKREIEFDFTDKDIEVNKVKMKNTGWMFSDIDIKAIEDFIYGRSCSMQEVLKYALRYYIPQEIYEDILKRQGGSKEKVVDISLVKLNELKDKFGDLENYHTMIDYESAYNNNQFSHITSKPSWKIPILDYMAVIDFKKAFNISYQKIAINAIRFYLSGQNYKHAEELLKIIEKHKEENIAVYRGEIDDRFE
ncbi:hypothetical protein UT300018_27710 [Clostridium faecium]|uniref:ATPase n=1 Tax=Clostridium faecium TaxID=2762223 RepID=A0ABR8YUR5_9CLOT|nr:hypothetical protein [Clostridium faecium]MBD8047970.1 hypothetical protein [Clostridium faecium]